MLSAFYGLARNPFDSADCPLLPQQQEIYDTLKVHSQQGGLCLVLGVPGLGKSMIKEALRTQADPKRMLVVTVARTLHTYANTIRSTSNSTACPSNARSGSSSRSSP